MLKCSDIFAFICAFRIDILAVTETFLDGTINDGEICQGHYQMCHWDRSCHGRGVFIIIREGIRVFLMDDLNSLCEELLFLEVSTTCGPMHMLFGVFYCPPAQGTNHELIALSNCLLSVSTLSIVLCGDFNLPYIHWSRSVGFPTISSPAANKSCDLVQENCLTQLVSAPTRCRHLLDLVLRKNHRNFLSLQKLAIILITQNTMHH